MPCSTLDANEKYIQHVTQFQLDPRNRDLRGEYSGHYECLWTTQNIKGEILFWLARNQLFQHHAIVAQISHVVICMRIIYIPDTGSE
jgi:hypothetical protein